MFPRRRTDQVYATLQQVQRRITEQGGTPLATATPAGMAAPAGRTPTPGPLPVIRPGPQIHPQDPPPPPLLPPGVGAHQRYSVVLSGTLASLLVVCWIASIAAAILITTAVVKPGVSTVEAVARPVAGGGSAVAPSRWKLVVQSETRATGEARQRLARERDQFNEAMKRNAAKGWQPLFELEEGVNGGIQLVYGAAGVDKSSAAMQELASRIFGRYSGAAWVEIR